MLVMRPAQVADLAEVQRLAADSPVGVTSLPDDTERLREKIAASEASFAAEVSFNGEESYFFVLEDSESGRLVGCSGIVASAGYSEPFYSFRNETFVHNSRELKIHNKIHVLSLCHDLTGNSLLTSFYVERPLVDTAWSELNSRGRLLFVASHPERFADAVVVEIVGHSDEAGDSPFWDAVGRNFFDMNYAEAERLCGLKSLPQLNGIHSRIGAIDGYGRETGPELQLAATISRCSSDQGGCPAQQAAAMAHQRHSRRRQQATLGAIGRQIAQQHQQAGQRLHSCAAARARGNCNQGWRACSVRDSDRQLRLVAVWLIEAAWLRYTARTCGHCRP